MDNPVGARQKAFKVAANLAVALASCFFKTGTIRRGDGVPSIRSQSRAGGDNAEACACR